MRKLVYYIGMSLDGVIAGPEGQVDFYTQGTEADASYAAWVNERYPETVPTPMRSSAGLENVPGKRFDTVLMGRGTYQLVLDHGLTSPYAHLRQYVVSGSLGEIADPAVTLAEGDPIALARELKQESGLDIWLCGGGKLAGALLPELDELIVKSYPVVAGAGIPAFGGEFSPARFTPARRESFENGTTMTWYSRP
ncbi:dihydrofolate reductase family protein [Amycolatopsis sp. NPDC059027]|uniref:dihydrofolate reductase family protein n=1 Tax=unclassified Amycolatopsis TaxID=2618356 RepID=UPI00367361D9